MKISNNSYSHLAGLKIDMFEHGFVIDRFHFKFADNPALNQFKKDLGEFCNKKDQHNVVVDLLYKESVHNLFESVGYLKDSNIDIKKFMSVLINGKPLDCKPKNKHVFEKLYSYFENFDKMPPNRFSDLSRMTQEEVIYNLSRPFQGFKRNEILQFFDVVDVKETMNFNNVKLYIEYYKNFLKMKISELKNVS